MRRLAPVSGPLEGMTVISISGANFSTFLGAALHCVFAQSDSHRRAVPATVINNTEATCVVPPASSKNIVSVCLSKNAEGYPFVCGTTQEHIFRYYENANVTGVEPLFVPWRGATLVTVSGSNFRDDFDKLECLVCTLRVIQPSI